LRYAGNLGKKVSGVVGVYGLWQDLQTDPVHTEEAGSAQWRFIQGNTNPLWKTPGLLDNYGIRTTSRLLSTTLATFAQADWTITEKLHFLPGLRYNYDKKVVTYDRKTYGGLQTADPALLALKNQVYNNQSFNVEAIDKNFSGQVTLQYFLNKNVNTFGTYSVSYKPVGVNIGGLPRVGNETALDLAQVKPEYVSHYEFGIKSKPSSNSVLNIVFHNSDIKDYQTLVQTPEPGVNRGYLANAEKVRVYGLEFDGNLKVSKHFTINSAIAYTVGKYVSFVNAPVPLEEVGGPQAFKDISGGDLPGISRWAGSVGVETNYNGKLLNLLGEYFLNFETFYRSQFSSSPSPSQFLNIDGYSLLNARIGFRAKNNLTLQIWGRNLLNVDYYEQLIAAPGSAGHYAGVVGDPQTFGVTIQYALK
jgi:iron complex outermembrane receptor protein